MCEIATTFTRFLSSFLCVTNEGFKWYVPKPTFHKSPMLFHCLTLHSDLQEHMCCVIPKLTVLLKLLTHLYTTKNALEALKDKLSKKKNTKNKTLARDFYALQNEKETLERWSQGRPTPVLSLNSLRHTR